MCYSTLVLPGSPEPAETYSVDTGLGVYTFSQDRPGIVPKLLENLAVWRKDAKKKMAACKAAGDSFGAGVWDGAQLAFKVSMNSVYGFLGASHGFLPCVPIAASVTATGRLMIEKTKTMAETLVPGSEVVYGDSVAGYTPLLLRCGSEVWYDTFDAVSEKLTWSERRDGKEYAECEYEVWSDDGWTRLERLIRHDAPEKLVRVLTHAGVVDVTADHSLLLPDGTPVCPFDVGVGTKLMHHPLPEFTGFSSISEKEARIFGYFMGTGSCVGYQWGIRTSSTYLELCREVYPQVEFDSFGRVLVALGNVGLLCSRYRRLLYHGSAKCVPRDILGSSYDVRKAFWDGWCDAGGVLDFDEGPTRQIGLAGLFALGMVSRPNDLEIQKMYPVDYIGRYVYDCTTANHHFAAGPGTLVVHNTDSVMVKFNVPPEKRHCLETHFEVAQRVASQISETFPGCVELEFEKCYFPYCLYSKKRYAGLMYTNPSKHDYIDVKGLQLVRRDNAPIVKKVSQDILDAIMYEKSTEKALDAARRCVLQVISGGEPLENFVVSKSLRGSYANPNAQPHVQVARKIKDRTGESLGSGERVPYVFVVDDNIDGLISSRAEDPGYVVEKSLELDYLYYLENQLLSPIKALLEVLVKDPEKAVLETPEIARVVEDMRDSRKRLVRDVKRVKLNVKNKQHEITRFFGKT